MPSESCRQAYESFEREVLPLVQSNANVREVAREAFVNGWIAALCEMRVREHLTGPQMSVGHVYGSSEPRQPGDVLIDPSGAQYLLGDLIGLPSEGTECDAAQWGSFPSVDPDGRCRCTVCPRCRHHTGNSHQGHYWGHCMVTGTTREFHLCCPDPAYSCELEAVGSDRPVIVCLCGSTRFAEQFRQANLGLTLAGEIVLSIGCDTKSDADLDAASEMDLAAVKDRLDELHKRKIDLADRVFVVSDASGYFGESTRGEIDYAISLGKPVEFATPAASARYCQE